MGLLLGEGAVNVLMMPVSEEILPSQNLAPFPEPYFQGNLGPLGAIFPRKYILLSEIWPPQNLYFTAYC